MSKQQSTMAPTTMKMAGVIPLPDQPLHLLPLLQPKKKSKPALERLPNGDSTSRRVAFTTASVDAGSSSKTTEWISTTHVYPSAFPRSHYACTAPPAAPIPEADASRAKQDRAAEQEARKADFQRWDELSTVYAVESLYPPSSEEEADKLAQNLAMSDPPQLWNCVQRIAPSSPVKVGITLVLAHANGFHKEIYEPTVQNLISSLLERGKGSPQIAEVFSIDTYNSGDAAALNSGLLGQMTSWLDQPRDIRQFLDHYMPAQNEDPPVLLQGHAQGSTRKGRTMVGVGHSFSGAAMLMLNSTVPDLFDGLIVIDPVGAQLDYFPQSGIPRDIGLARGAIARKDVFSTRKAAEDYLNSKPFFQAWDPAVISLHTRFGFRPVAGSEKESDPPVTLSMSKWSEAQAFSTNFLGGLGAASVKRSRYTGWGHLICTSQGSESIFGPPNGLATLQSDFEKYFSTTNRASQEIMQGGHLIAQEQPKVLGARLAEVITAYSDTKRKAKL